MRFALFSLLSAVTIAAAWLIITTLSLGIPPMPSSRKLRRAVLEAIADLPPGSRVVDIGSGWGGLVRRIARERPDLIVEGYERSPIPYLFSRLVSALCLRAPGGGRRGNRPRLHGADAREQNLADGVCYITYLSPDGMKWVRALFEKHLPRNARLVSAVFAVPGWTPARILRPGDIHGSRVYVYELGVADRPPGA